MSGKMVPITVYTNSLEAGMIKSRLESAGIQAFLEGEESGNILGIVNLQGVRVLIHEDDLAQAEEILDQFETEEADDYHPPQRKKRRKPRPSAEAIRAPKESPLATSSPVRTEHPARTPPVREVQSPKAEAEHQPPEAGHPPPDHEPDEPNVSLQPSWTPGRLCPLRVPQGAILGMFLLCRPPYYSLYMLVRMATLPGELSKRGRMMGWGALAVNLLVCLIVSQVIRYRLGRE